MASSISELTMLMNYQDRQRARLESRERQESRDNWSRFTSMATQNLATADEITNLAENETDLTVLDTLLENLQETRTGVDFVDQVIDVRADQIESRKNTVVATNRINEHIDALNKKMGEGRTVGVKEALDTLRGQYGNIASQQTSITAKAQDDKLTQTRRNLTLQLWKGEFDTDKLKPGNQFPEWMGKHEKSFYTQTVEPGVRVAEGSGDPQSYTSAISRLVDALPAMRREKTAYQTVNMRKEDRVLKDKEKEVVAQTDDMRALKFAELETLAVASIQAFADMNKDLQNEWNFGQTLTNVGAHVASKTGKNLKTLDARGMLKALDHSIMLNSNESYKGMGDTKYLNAYIIGGDPLDRDHLNKMETLIEMNSFIGKVDDAGNKIKKDKYNVNYGYGEKAHRGMFQLINTRKKLLEIIYTPGMLIQDVTQNKGTSSNIGSQIKR